MLQPYESDSFGVGAVFPRVECRPNSNQSTPTTCKKVHSEIKQSDSQIWKDKRSFPILDGDRPSLTSVSRSKNSIYLSRDPRSGSSETSALVYPCTTLTTAVASILRFVCLFRIISASQATCIATLPIAMQHVRVEPASSRSIASVSHSYDNSGEEPSGTPHE
ncbi:uncharacterized protein EI97DRAFT_237088 [Westerdykella ornata]|uniref:Uncharacterized protein n=1 Tax=Westerdykella ornata TaxID=318751 RepID=A0A6A6J609_WESOR|nr:uncharacterized protein EI97DRAFT_237088 [Westerdykella ornata]KAF2272020.1 hypothetical protein EI97DRAFT_237088 [Westerdykella ornata]